MKLADAISKLAPVSQHVTLGGLRKLDLPSSLLTGDEIEVRIRARITKAGFREDFDAKTNQFKSPLQWECTATAYEVELVGVKERAAIDAEFFDRLESEEDSRWEDGRRTA